LFGVERAVHVLQERLLGMDAHLQPAQQSRVCVLCDQAALWRQLARSITESSLPRAGVQAAGLQSSPGIAYRVCLPE